MRAKVLAAGLVGLLAGCEATGPGFELIPETTLPSFDCADDELPPTLAPLRARLLGNTGAPAAGTLVEVSGSPSGFVQVFDSRSVLAIQGPAEGPWFDLGSAGQIWAELPGDVSVAPPLRELAADAQGGVQAWVRVDLLGACEANLPLEQAVVTLTSGDLSVDAVLTYAGQE